MAPGSLVLFSCFKISMCKMCIQCLVCCVFSNSPLGEGMEVVFVEGAGHSNAQMSSVAFDHSGLLDETEITRPE